MTSSSIFRFHLSGLLGSVVALSWVLALQVAIGFGAIETCVAVALTVIGLFWFVGTNGKARNWKSSIQFLAAISATTVATSLAVDYALLNSGVRAHRDIFSAFGPVFRKVYLSVVVITSAAGLAIVITMFKLLGKRESKRTLEQVNERDNDQSNSVERV